MTSQKSFWEKIVWKPSTKQGRWSLWLALAAFILNFMWMILPGGAISSYLFGIASGIFATYAIVKCHERAWVVYLAIFPFVWVLVFLLGEFLIPH